MADRSTVRAATRKWSPARTLLALLLLAMAAGQLSDVGGFARILDTYRIFPGSVLAIVVALAWTALATLAFVRGLTIDNCGCFGIHLGQSLRWWVLIEDAEFIALAAWVYRRERRGSSAAEEEPVGTRPPSVLTGQGRRSG